MSPNFIKLFFFQINAHFFWANRKRVSPNFIKLLFFKSYARFVWADQKWVSPNCIKLLFFFKIICTFLLSQSKVNVSEFHQIIFFQIICTFLLSLSKVSVSEFHQIFLSTFIKFLFDQSKPSVPQFFNSSLSLIPPKIADSIQRQFRTSRRRRHSVVKTWPRKRRNSTTVPFQYLT